MLFVDESDVDGLAARQNQQAINKLPDPSTAREHMIRQGPLAERIPKECREMI